MCYLNRSTRQDYLPHDHDLSDVIKFCTRYWTHYTVRAITNSSPPRALKPSLSTAQAVRESVDILAALNPSFGRLSSTHIAAASVCSEIAASPFCRVFYRGTIDRKYMGNPASVPVRFQKWCPVPGMAERAENRGADQPDQSRSVLFYTF